MRILLVEDDRMIGSAVARALKDSSYAVDWVRNGANAIVAAELEPYDLMLLDLGIPAPDGLTVLRQLRKIGRDLSVIIITARDQLEDRIGGLDSGADDYLVKPFEVGELLARIRAVTRRKAGERSPLLSTGDLQLNPTTFEASYRGVIGRLTSREFSLLHALMLRPGAVLSRKELEEQIYGWNEEVESNAVEFLIHTVRKKIGATAIRNVRGAGWFVERAT